MLKNNYFELKNPKIFKVRKIKQKTVGFLNWTFGLTKIIVRYELLQRP